ncbi:MAG: hypothetical protein ACJA09_002628 [Alcanivorax sp.]|jgi:hypothetical protein
MTFNNDNFNAHELCSRKLWQIINTEHNNSADAKLRAAVEELSARRHYLAELSDLGKIKDSEFS